ncbi:MAG: CoA-disulfide reductase [Bacteriovoracaceae bacterium]|nr:CoA-disulfide reductase [Bacteriovoracaceae bacterium]
MKVLIVGGVAGGATAAARLRRNDESAEIIVFEKGPYMSFANCGLPYYIGGVIKEREELLLQTPEGMKNRYKVEVRVNSEVISIDRKNKIVEFVNHKTGDKNTESYDKLILAPGAAPIVPPIPGINSDKVFTLRNIPDTDMIVSKVQADNVQHVTVVGGGFIGVEMAENFHELGIKVTLVEATDQIMAPFDKDFAVFARDEVKKHKVDLILNNSVKEFKDSSEHTEMVDSKSKITIILANGDEIVSDMVIWAIGVKPESRFAAESGIEINDRGAFIVNGEMQTNDPDIYAVGDAIEVRHFVDKKEAMIPLAWPANRQGRMVADIITGVKSRAYSGTLGTGIVQIFDLTFASTGLNEKYLQRSGREYLTTTVIRGQHVGYYPGMSAIVLKLVFNKEGDILGAQAFGEDGVDKRIDVIAMAIKSGAKVWDLQDFEPCYAPPFGAAKDPVNIAGYSAENILDGLVSSVSVMDLGKLDMNTHVLLDVRNKDEWDDEHIDGATLIPVDDLRQKVTELDKSKTYITVCKVGQRGYIAARILEANGIKSINLSGGMTMWSAFYRGV